MSEREALEDRYYAMLPDEDEFDSWVVFKWAISASRLTLCEVGQVKAVDGDRAIQSLAEHEASMDSGRFVAMRPEDVRGKAVKLTHIAHLED